MPALSRIAFEAKGALRDEAGGVLRRGTTP